ncbi:helix-turn-helix domain-containing protein [Catenuloplanes atrovinosus]|uniref:AraC-like DNA-binding protein n=1 Tax=Catenuloplanes atrovinosus TaxID=137266 RepID=A0AAE3YHY9_9ACTN|nr:AraC family transcriptional regulator [Catenuloplanes atrovinosus]MDR7273770.1 AraC-like DNA-binding protein [Catenuloplanes atrovinosus]
MVGIGQARQGIEPARPTGIGATTLSDFPGDGPHLLDRNLLLLVTVGQGAQEIDFVRHDCRPGTLLWARPGQAIRLNRRAGLDAVLISWHPEDLPDHWRPDGRCGWQLAGEDEDAVISEVSQLVVDRERHAGTPLADDLLRHQLTVLMLRIALLAGGGAARAPERTTFREFTDAVEAGYTRTRRVEEYARELGCSVRTLTRACLAATGRSAKQVIDDRVALQARRLLACTDAPIADIGRALGFPEPTNFGRFFHRETGRSPGAFRAALPGPPLDTHESAPHRLRTTAFHEM